MEIIQNNPEPILNPPLNPPNFDDTTITITTISHENDQHKTTEDATSLKLPPISLKNRKEESDKIQEAENTHDNFYSLDFKYTGLGLMINNYKFNRHNYEKNTINSINNHKNSQDEQAENEIASFETLAANLNFQTHVNLNQSKLQVKHLIKHYTSSFDFTDYACLLVCFASQGNGQSSILSSDCFPIQIYADIVEPFCRVESLRNKPKIFLFDCARGRGDELMVGGGGWSKLGIIASQHHQLNKAKKAMTSFSSNNTNREFRVRDFFLGTYSMVSNFGSRRMSSLIGAASKGACFLTTFFEVVENHGKFDDWDELTRKVTKVMNERYRLIPEFQNRAELKLTFAKFHQQTQQQLKMKLMDEQQNEIDESDDRYSELLIVNTMLLWKYGD